MTLSELVSFLRAQIVGKHQDPPKTRKGAKHDHGNGKGRKDRRYVVKGLRP